jgi:mono/diheme cytochrome c family protein
MRRSAESQGVPSIASHVFRLLPVVAAIAVLAPAAVLAQGTPGGDAPAAAAAPAGDAPSATAGEQTVSSYTDDQASRGKSLYKDDCSTCHGSTLGGSGETPTLVGKGFRERWFVGPIEPFMTYVSTNMPQDNPGGLDPQSYADIAAYLMSRNKVPAGDTELPGDKDAWATITLPPLEE